MCTDPSRRPSSADAEVSSGTLRRLTAWMRASSSPVSYGFTT